MNHRPTRSIDRGGRKHCGRIGRACHYQSFLKPAGQRKRTGYSDASELAKARRYAHDIIGDLNNGMHLFIDWNIALDEMGGPNHVQNYCDTPIICDTQAGTYEKRLTFDYTGHFSKYIEFGAKRIAFTKYTDALDVTAAKNTDDTIVVVIVNRLSLPQNVIFRFDGKKAQIKMEADSITTVCMNR